ncbi:hypothetical protein HMPREF9582_01132 [Cutibacterium acnes HL060PA1]|nr:hypothetical protein HMPREF9578_00289 [Cutibacterium acnes HL110PA4]EFT65293.1 hypothetical protein HMPREF9582_01132 [Cutibacterium acnes HL060PA1]EFT75404.1 hypothetical protein HMPREF9599_01003 [Cutibacterium acnes HL050PA2]EGE69368.1 hypothetical protein HMPREF9341_01699 [Cutibacterium acnes HL103PA1]GAE79149.1 hypothetical protein JCM18920_697 [Cutibacterium acnes JCM 18920]
MSADLSLSAIGRHSAARFETAGRAAGGDTKFTPNTGIDEGTVPEPLWRPDR